MPGQLRIVAIDYIGTRWPTKNLVALASYILLDEYSMGT